MRTNQYFWATVGSSLIITIGLIGLAIKGFLPAYQVLLQLCGIEVGACRAMLSDLNPISIFSAATLVWMVTVLTWQLVKTKIVLKRVSSRAWPTPNYLQTISFRIGLNNRLKVVDGSVLFCSGLLRPEVVIGRELLKNLNRRELEAALTHELYHLRNYDPIKVYLTTSLAKALFFLPAIAALTKLYLKEKELAADRLAEQNIGRIYLAKALYKVLEKNNPLYQLSPGLLPSFANTSLRGSQYLSNISSWTWTGTIMVLTVLLISLVRISHPISGGC